MDIRLLVIDIVEKLGLIASAALVSVLVPPLRNRLLGIGGQPQDRFVALLLGFCLSMWGAKMGQTWLGVQMNFVAVGILMASRFRIGAFAGLLGGLFFVLRVEPSLPVPPLGWSIVVALTAMGSAGGWLAEHYPATFERWQAFPTACILQVGSFAIIAGGLAVSGGDAAGFIAAWPALLVQMVSTAAGITLFVGVVRVVLTREENAVALVEARATADQLSLEALRSRLEPHFLFNALNTLRATIRVDPARARDLVSDLSDLYRYLLTHPNDAPLKDEFEHAKAYLGIERARLGARLEVEMIIPVEVRQVQVPALLLQPLVENAVKHGVAAHEGNGKVEVIAWADGDMLQVEVIDSSEGKYVGVVKEGTGIALKTLRARLDQRYKGAASLELVKHATGTCAQVRLPLAVEDEQA